MDVQKISSGSAFETVAGYSRAIVVEHADHKEVFVSGCSGFDYASMTISDDVVAQARQCFINIAAALEKVGGDLSHVTRVRYYITDAAYWEQAAPVSGEALAKSKPAATCLVCGLVDAGMKIEIEVDARIPR